MLCFVLLSVIPAKATVNGISGTNNKCHNTPAKQSPCNSSPKNDCGQGICNILSCPYCGYLKTDPIAVDPVVPVLMELKFSPYYIGDLSDYSMINWNPPKV